MLSYDSAGDLSRDHGLNNTALGAINMGLGQILHINWVLPLERRKKKEGTPEGK